MILFVLRESIMIVVNICSIEQITTNANIEIFFNFGRSQIFLQYTFFIFMKELYCIGSCCPYETYAIRITKTSSTSQPMEYYYISQPCSWVWICKVSGASEDSFYRRCFETGFVLLCAYAPWKLTDHGSACYAHHLRLFVPFASSSARLYMCAYVCSLGYHLFTHVILLRCYLYSGLRFCFLCISERLQRLKVERSSKATKKVVQHKWAAGIISIVFRHTLRGRKVNRELKSATSGQVRSWWK